MPFVVGEQVGPYRIVEQLGQGGMSTVYKAYHAALDRYVALKVLHPMFKGDRSFLERFQREARIVARLEHPHIVPVYDFSEHEGVPYLVMRYVQGRTLKALLSEQGAPPLDRIVEILRPVCDALAYAHAVGVLHRDIKPSNVLLSQEGKVFVTDYGLAKMVQSGDSTISQDRMIGTPQYISPEQAKGETVDARTDLYSLGVVLFEMVTGRVPYTADTPFAIVHDHIFSPLPLPSQVDPAVPPAVEQVILKALAKSPEDRYQSAGDMFGALAAAAQALGVQPEPLAPPAPSAPGPPPGPAPVVPDAVPAPAADETGAAGLPPSTVTFPVAEESVGAPGVAEPPAEVPAAKPSPLAELASAVKDAMAAGLASAKPGLDRARAEVESGLAEAREKAGAGLSEAASAVRAALPTEPAPTPPPIPEPAPPEPAVAAPAAGKKKRLRWPVYVGIAAAVVVVVLLSLVLLRRMRGRVLVRQATATAQAAAPLPPRPSEPLPPQDIPMDPFPIQTGDGYAPPGAIPFAEGEARLRELDERINRDPENPAPYMERGDVLFLLERFDGAEEAYRRNIDLDPQNLRAHYNLGVTLLFLRRPEQALGEFQWVMDATGGQVDPPVLFNLGLTHAMLGHRPDAIEAFREFLRQYPDEDDRRRQALDFLRRLEEQ